MENLKVEYKGILEIKNTENFKNIYEEIKSSGENIISTLKEKLKEIKNESFEDSGKEFIASNIKNEIENTSNNEKEISDYKPYYEDNSNIGSGIGMEDAEDESSGGGGFQILNRDEERWKKKQKNVFEQGFSL